MIQKKFFTWFDFCKELGVDGEAVRQAVARGELPAYLHLRGTTAQLQLLSFQGGVEPASGHGEVSMWHRTEKPFPGAGGSYYKLTGWFQVDPYTLRQAGLVGEFRSTPTVLPAPECDGLNDGDVWELSTETYHEYEGVPYFEEDWTIAPTLSDLWFRDETLAKLMSGSKAGPTDANDKSLTTRERNTLLRIIAGLAKYAGIDVTNGKAAAQIEAAVATAGFDGPKEKTIRGVVSELGKLD
ncbi:hypothetical protein N800_10185 [Lysobacter daejeonensis GH1-9]|uniref:Uncharacterized protein n=1 Tax=Lysobacter daejeonensis GH1-9 TaxID=1385517 RepID=A0A0A0F114_9GAMM|nr:hypothetical protein [Lysobacter daejeonensis]KGM55988.1 hypothetical protein N800_10185 [Lysobacter daejeonensis GH1-9]